MKWQHQVNSFKISGQKLLKIALNSKVVLNFHWSQAANCSYINLQYEWAMSWLDGFWRASLSDAVSFWGQKCQSSIWTAKYTAQDCIGLGCRDRGYLIFFFYEVLDHISSLSSWATWAIEFTKSTKMWLNYGRGLWHCKFEVYQVNEPPMWIACPFKNHRMVTAFVWNQFHHHLFCLSQ